MSTIVIPKTVTNKTIEDFINNLSLQSLEVSTITDTGSDILINNTSGGITIQTTSGDIRIQTSGGKVIIPEIIEQPPAIIFKNLGDSPPPPFGFTTLFCDGERLGLAKSNGTKDYFLSMRSVTNRTATIIPIQNITASNEVRGSALTFNDNAFLYVANSDIFQVSNRFFRFEIDMNDVFGFIDTVSNVTGSVTVLGSDNRIANGIAQRVSGTSRVDFICRGINDIGGETLGFSITIMGSYTKNIP